MSQSKPTFQNCTISQLLAIFEENKAIPQLKREVESLKMIIEDKKDVIREIEEEIQEAYTEFCAYRSEHVHKDPILDQLQQMQDQSEVFKAKYSGLVENHLVEETTVEVTPQEAE